MLSLDLLSSLSSFLIALPGRAEEACAGTEDGAGEDDRVDEDEPEKDAELAAGDVGGGAVVFERRARHRFGRRFEVGGGHGGYLPSMIPRDPCPAQPDLRERRRRRIADVDRGRGEAAGQVLKWGVVLLEVVPQIGLVAAEALLEEGG